MNEDTLNMSVRKFLKKVGVTAQRDIEQAIRDADAAGTLPARPLKATVLLTLDGVDLKVTIDGDIETV
ncbi:MAG: hypothetical protein KJ904_05025 [Alphaproteobacteria bacterium]|nr:hypothetical protein [Alphaproteobacteria bacterium]MBU0796620.1 hypothetical protein [Alphaproteobacteria bacterium]MBU0886507.1 hypothetical protein [Alphaproteobacteria bacterium]MBU1814095.1 hypothetical protein [Alphaproteobacteria bacterium]